MKVVVGLGNPGRKYERTRHNVGFETIDLLEKKWNTPVKEEKFKGVYGVERNGTEKIVLLKPMTYMNLSGESVSALMNYYNVEPEDLLVIYDDLDLEPGRIRLRQKGSAGGHNGMKSIIKHLGTEHFNRIRIGVGRPEPGKPVPDYVLGTFPPDERPDVDEAEVRAAEAVDAWKDKPFLQVMNEFNG
ncbi:aminoacyl-tRNA hydrolase [Alkalicoccus urumqiensis]|uniref:Peptidyl-tRNA hydrolase n=1 Tax=Alkalicoccus urumqiensis TaxID=1548213 RepID=A0A2P6MDQ7_ALKUR|nr:aminoacyl-tRNA hydrolase [Alkalicoccus urumqiensis]PRO64419.1 aminoacyl-tRNA hydrolase [Alkalicoccus urumqiensis]